MHSKLRFVVLMALAATVALAQIGGSLKKAQLLTVPLSSQILAPGTNISEGFQNATNETIKLPNKGRYLLWIADAIFALEDRIEIDDPSGVQGSRLFNFIAAYIKDTPGQNVVLFVPSEYAELPRLPQRREVQARFAKQNVLFDGREAISGEVSVAGFGSRPNLNGLYLMDGQTVRHRFLSSIAWQAQKLKPVILENSLRFLQGKEPSVTPYQLGFPGGRVPENVSSGRPSLIVRVTGLEADAPKGGFQIQTIETANGTKTEKFVPDTATAQLRFGIESLTPYLKRLGLRGLGMITNDSKIGSLQKTFPEWDFAVIKTPEDWVRWSELSAASLITKDGRVLLHFLASGSGSQNSSLLDNALEKLGK